MQIILGFLALIKNIIVDFSNYSKLFKLIKRADYKRIKGYPFEIEININNKNGAILCDQVRSLDWKERKATKISQLDKKLLNEAIVKLCLLLEG